MRVLLVIALLGFVALAFGQGGVSTEVKDGAADDAVATIDFVLNDAGDSDEESNEDSDSNDDDDDDDDDDDEEDDDDNSDVQSVQNDEVETSVDAADVPLDVEETESSADVKKPMPSKTKRNHKGKGKGRGNKVSKERAQQILSAMGWKKFKDNKNIVKLLNKH